MTRPKKTTQAHLPEPGRRWTRFSDDPQRGAAAVGSRSPAFGSAMLRQAIVSTPAIRSASDDEKQLQVQAAIDFLESIAPRDELEGMLAIQMKATHDAAMSCYQKAALPGQIAEACDRYYKHAEKLSRLYAQQMAALDKHRGKGQQKITVEHVTVEAGGQAIVGEVSVAKDDAVFARDGQPANANVDLHEPPPQKRGRVRQRVRSSP